MTNQERMLKILDETVQFYSEDPTRRSFNQKRCLYFDSETGNKCAVGRCLEHPDVLQKMVEEKPSNITAVSHANIPLTFKPGYEGLPIRFWTGIQRVHDHVLFWTSEGLTNQGKDWIDHFRWQIKNGVYDNISLSYKVD